MGVEVKGVKELRAKFKIIGDGIISTKELGKITSLVKTQISQRTNKGRDFKNIPFDKYSPEYRKVRKSKGRGKKVDLQLDKRMLKNMSTKTTGSNGKIFFSRREEALKAFYHTTKGVGKKRVTREFFKLSNKNKSFVMRQYTKYIQGLL